MFFAIKSVIKPIDIDNQEELTFALTNKISFKISKIPSLDIKGQLNIGDMYVTIIMEKTVDGNLMQYFKPNEKEKPANLKNFLSDLYDELNTELNKLIKKFRWWRGLQEYYQYMKVWGSLKWSFDAKEWYGYPNEVELVLRMNFAHLQWKYENLVDIQNYLKSDNPEPLGSELLSEAWALRKENKRSSLVIGIAALEACLKSCISKLNPQSEWIKNDRRNKYILRVIKEDLFTMKGLPRLKGKKNSLSETTSDAIQKGIEIRNDILHGNEKEINIDSLELLLRKIRGLLYLFQYYLGESWCTRYIENNLLENEIN